MSANNRAELNLNQKQTARASQQKDDVEKKRKKERKIEYETERYDSCIYKDRPARGARSSKRDEQARPQIRARSIGLGGDGGCDVYPSAYIGYCGNRARILGRRNLRARALSGGDPREPGRRMCNSLHFHFQTTIIIRRLRFFKRLHLFPD